MTHCKAIVWTKWIVKIYIMKFELIVANVIVLSQFYHESERLDSISYQIFSWFLFIESLSVAPMYRKQAIKRQWVMKKCRWRWNMCAASSLVHILTKMQTSSGVTLLHVHPSIPMSQHGSFAIVYMYCFVTATPMPCETRTAMLTALRIQDSILWVITFYFTSLLLGIIGLEISMKSFFQWLLLIFFFWFKLLSFLSCAENKVGNSERSMRTFQTVKFQNVNFRHHCFIALIIADLTSLCYL